MKTYLLFISAFLLISCGEKRPDEITRGEKIEVTQLSEALQYNLHGVDAENLSCTTGAKIFRTLHEMCLELQRPLDSECALEQKQLLFSQRCLPAGYQYREAAVCEARLVEVNVHTNLAWDNIVESKKICIGTRKNQVTKETFKHDRGELGTGIDYEMELDSKTGLGFILITDRTNNGPKDLRLDFKGSSVQLRDETADKRLMVELTCQRTWACEE